MTEPITGTITAGALVLLVVREAFKFAQERRNGGPPPPTVHDAATSEKLDRLIANSERQITLLEDIKHNGRNGR